MRKIALVLAIAAVGEGLIALHLVRQLQQERESAQTLQARVTELERAAKQGATFVAVPTRPAASPFASVVQSAPAQPASPAAQSGITVANAQFSTDVAAPNPQQMREQMFAAMERQRALLQDPDYREAMLTQQKMVLMRSSPDVGKDLNLTPDQVDRLFGVLADQSLQAMDNVGMWEEQPDTATVRDMQRKANEQQRANEAELKRVLGEAKYREWQDYQANTGVRYEATRLRTVLSDAGLPLDPSLAKPLMKVLQDQQKLEQQRLQQFAASDANARLAQTTFAAPDGVNVIQLMTNSVDSLAKTQQRQREALARVLSPEQLKVIEEEHNADLQMQRAQERLMRAQQAAGVVTQEAVITRDDAVPPSASH